MQTPWLLFQIFSPFWSFGAASLHIHRDVLEECITRHIWLLRVPARTTWLLQPLDTHAFARYKAYLRNLWKDLMADGSATFASWITLLSKVSTEFLQSLDWSRAFTQDGLIGNRQLLSKRLLAYLGDRTASLKPSQDQPSIDEVALRLPRKCNLHYPMWMHQPQGRKRWMFVKWSTSTKRKKGGVKISVASET